MKIILLRHGETLDFSEFGRTYDVLSSLGIEQARSVAKDLTKYKIDAIYCGNSKRTKQTADEIIKIIDAELNYAKGLDEISRGIFTNNSYEEFLEEWKKYNYSRDYKPLNGESINEGTSKSLNFLKKELLQKDYSCVLCITHAGIIANVLMDLYSFEFEEAKPNHCEISVLEVKSDEISLRLLNNKKADKKISLDKCYEKVSSHELQK